MNFQDLASHTASPLGDGARLYERVAMRIAGLIERGTLRPGDKVPSVRKCSEQQSVSIATVTQAYQMLENRGLIEGRPQSGYYVRVRRWTPPPEPGKSAPAARAVSVRVSDLVMEIIKANRNPGLVRLGASLPSPELYPVQTLHRALSSAGRRSPQLAHSYDPVEGNQALRVEIARRALEAGCTLAPDDIITTVGVTEGLHLCLRAAAKPGDVIAVESPAYFGILQIIESLGMRVCEIPTYPRHGICLDELTARLKCCRIKACVFTLNYSNPLGSCMPDEKKQELVRILTRREIPLIEDDIYGNLTFGPVRPKAAKAYDEQGWVMLCDGFSKTLSPGYRVGWVAPGRFKAKVEYLKYVTTAASPSLPQMAIAEFLRNGGFEHHLRRIRRLYAGQARSLQEAISRHFPAGTKVTRPNGGMSIWVELPRRVDALKVHQRALAAGISIAPGHIFSPKQKYKNFIRVSSGNPWSEKVEEAVRELGRIVWDLAGRPEPNVESVRVAAS